jgi:hypothetical protein
MTKPFDVFLSHHSGDRSWVIELKKNLEARGIKVWLDRDQIRPGNLFAEALEKGIKESRSVAIIISPESMKSDWVKAEYYRALKLATTEHLQLIPVLYKQADAPGFLEDRNYVDFRNSSNYTEQLENLIWGITDQKPGSSPTQPSGELRKQVNAARQIVDWQIALFSSGAAIYPDRCDQTIQQVEHLASIVENIRPHLPSTYNASLIFRGLTSQVKTQKDDLSEFQKTCPPGDSLRRERLVGHLRSINNLLDSLSAFPDSS